jgi:hypothetical protein
MTKSETERSAAGLDASMSSAAAKQVVSGNLMEMLVDVPGALQEPPRAAALTAYAHGFAMVGLVAAGVASIACFLNYKLVWTSETAPKHVVRTDTRPCLVPDCQTP